MADVESAGGFWESKDDTVLNERMLTELAAKVAAPSSTAAEVQTDDQKPTATMEGNQEDVMDIARRFVGDVAEMEGIEGFRQRYIDGINSYFLGFIRDPEAPCGSATSGFFKVPKEIRYRAGSEGLYDPTFFDLSILRALLLEMNNNGTSTTAHQHIRHYFSHLFSILQRVSEVDNSLKYVMKKIYEKREEIARCYDVSEEPRISSSSTDFVHLLALLLGGCFVFDTVFRWNPYRVYIKCCHLWASELWVDLLLLDNQIPFFILEIFYGMFYDAPSRYATEKLVFGFFKDFLPLNKQAFLRKEGEEPDRVLYHVLHFVYESLVPDSNFSSSPIPWWSWFRRQPLYQHSKREPEMRAIPTATRLQQVGVQFRPEKEKGLVLDFKRGVLRLPHLHVRKNTKKVLMNLIVWEQVCSEAGAACINNYAILMDYLIRTSKDVEILINSGVLEHSMASEEEVAQVFNVLGEDLGHTKSGEMYDANYFIMELSNELNDYCENKFNIWRAKLVNDYFGSPWSIISLVAGVFLLLFTLLQTFFSVFSYFLPPK